MNATLQNATLLVSKNQNETTFVNSGARKFNGRLLTD